MEQPEIKLTITKKFIFFFITVFGLISIFFIIDYCYTNYFRAPTSEIDYRAPHKIYSHTLAASFNGLDG